MKALVVYYSYTGNTKKIAEFLTDYLRRHFEVDIMELKTRESDKFLIQVLRAFRRVKPELESVNFDLTQYDLVCLGTPVWAFAPAPAVNTFLERCFGLENKEVILFCTYGSGLGVERCLDYIQKVLSKKGVQKIKRFFIQQVKAEDKNFVMERIKEVF